MKSITLHNIDDETVRLIEQISQEKGLSLNKTIQSILHESLGVNQDKGRLDFSDFSGVWSQEDFDLFEKGTQGFDQVDEEDWK
jgi:hypothetical protein